MFVEDHPDVISNWLIDSRAMCLITDKDSKILWVNESFSEFIGYSPYELLEQDIIENDISVKNQDQIAFQIQSKRCAEGKLTTFLMLKQYTPKNSPPVAVQVFCRRYPVQGEFICFQLEIVEVQTPTRLSLFQLEEIKNLQRETNREIAIMSKRLSRTGLVYLLKFLIRVYRKAYNKNPIKTVIITIFVLSALLGITGWPEELIRYLIHD